MRRVILAISLAACDSGSSGPVDASSDGVRADGPIDVILFPDQADISMCTPSHGAAACVAGVATASTEFRGGSTSHTLCGAAPVSHQATCATACAIESSLSTPYISQLLSSLVPHPELLCAETPVAEVGDACTVPYFHQTSANAPSVLETAVPCLPTRARLNNDGTVAGQDYLTCVNHVCASSPAPTIPNYLAACDAATIAQYGTPNTTGAVVIPFNTASTAPYSPAQNPWVCLLAWDVAGQVSTNGVTHACIGDWQCPANALCDDQIAVLAPSGAKVGVCKPGPRGTLTPAMLGD